MAMLNSTFKIVHLIYDLYHQIHNERNIKRKQAKNRVYELKRFFSASNIK